MYMFVKSLFRHGPSHRGKRPAKRLQSFRPGVEGLEERALMSGTPITGIQIVEQGQPAMNTPLPTPFITPAPLTAGTIITGLNLTTSGATFNAQTVQSFVQGVDQKLPSGFSLDGGTQVTIPPLTSSNCTINATILQGGAVQFDVDIKKVSGYLTVSMGASKALLPFPMSVMDDPAFNFTTDVDAQITFPNVQTLMSTGKIAAGTHVTMTANNIQVSGANVLGGFSTAANQIVPFIPSSIALSIQQPAKGEVPGSSEQEQLDADANQLATGVQILLNQAAGDGYSPTQNSTDPNGVGQIVIDGKGNLSYLAPLPGWVTENNGTATVYDNFDTNGQMTFSTIGKSQTLQTQQVGGLAIQMNNQKLVFAPGTIPNVIDIDTMFTTDAIKIQSLPAGVTVDYKGGYEANDSLTLGPKLANIAGTVNIENTQGAVALTIDDSSDPDQTPTTITRDSLSMLDSSQAVSPLPVLANVTYSGGILSSLHVLGGSGGNGFVVESTPAPFTLDAGSGSNYVYLGLQTDNLFEVGKGQGEVDGSIFAGSVQVNDQNGKTSLTIDNSGGNGFQYVEVTSNAVIYTNGPTLGYQAGFNNKHNGVSSLMIYGNLAGSDFNVQSVAPQTATTIYGSPKDKPLTGPAAGMVTYTVDYQTPAPGPSSPVTTPGSYPGADGPSNRYTPAPGGTPVAQAPPDDLRAVATALTTSFEYYSDFITNAYQQYLGRAPSTAEVEGWAGAMQQGLSDERVEAGFIGSDEYINNHGGPGAGWVLGMYQNLLGRTPAQSEVDGWVYQLDHGMSATDVAYGFAASIERESKRVTADYQHYLGRTPAQSEIDGWVGQFEAGYSNENVIGGFVGSAEYWQNHGSVATEWLDAAYEDILNRPADAAASASWLPSL